MEDGGGHQHRFALGTWHDWVNQRKPGIEILVTLNNTKLVMQGDS